MMLSRLTVNVGLKFEDVALMKFRTTRAMKSMAKACTGVKSFKRNNLKTRTTSNSNNMP